MKAEDILKIIERTGMTDLKIDHIKNYARIQIEKDRKRIKEAYYSDTDFGDFNNLLKSTKINLEL